MRIIVTGATGTIGKSVADALAARHEVVRVGHRSGWDTAPGLPAADVAKAYVESVESKRSGEVLDARAFV